MTESWTVHKFGGSVLRGAPDLDRLADRIAEEEGPAAVVVSALWGTTDRLLRAVDDPRYAERLVSDLRSHHLMFAPRLDRGRDGDRFEHVLESMAEALRLRRADPSDDAARIQLLASGERLSALVTAHHLRRCGFEAHAVGAEDIGMVLSGTHEAEAVDLVESAHTFDRSILHGIPVITGWLGSGRDGSLALLGRGGSDHTATAVAHLLGARRVILWKDVRGIHPVNPRWGINTEPIPYIPYELARMAAGLDATVLHPATVGPCIEGGMLLFAIGCVQGNDAMRLAAAVVFDRTFSPIAAGRATLTALQAGILTDTMGAEVEHTHVGDDSNEGFDTSILRSAPMVDMIPQLVARTKRAMRCDRASIFLINEARTEYARSFERSEAWTLQISATSLLLSRLLATCVCTG